MAGEYRRLAALYQQFGLGLLGAGIDRMAERGQQQVGRGATGGDRVAAFGLDAAQPALQIGRFEFDAPACSDAADAAAHEAARTENRIQALRVGSRPLARRRRLQRTQCDQHAVARRHRESGTAQAAGDEIHQAQLHPARIGIRLDPQRQHRDRIGRRGARGRRRGTAIGQPQRERNHERRRGDEYEPEAVPAADRGR